MPTSSIDTTSSPTFCAPSLDLVTHFAQAVCAECGPEFADPAIVQGFTDFMNVVARICANNLNRKPNPEFDPRVE